MEPIEFAIIGTGWCGGIRAEACAAHPLVKALHIAETRPERLKEVAASSAPRRRPRISRSREIVCSPASMCFSKSRSRSSSRKPTS